MGRIGILFAAAMAVMAGAGACGPSSSGGDAAAVGDIAPPRDLHPAPAPDQAAPDAAPPDSAVPVPDATALPDLVVLADKAAPPDLAWPNVYTPSGCDLTVNTNQDGTVNPFASHARNGQFYVSYVSTPGNLQLATVDPKTCKTVLGPLQVNKKAGDVYYYGAQSVTTDVQGNFYGAWQSNTGSHAGFAHSLNGKDFVDDGTIDTTSQNGLYPSVAAVGGGVVHVAWSGLYMGKYHPFYSRNDGLFQAGKWLAGAQVAVSQVQVDSTAIAVDGSGTIFVAWVTFDDNVYVSRSTNKGMTWSAPVRVNDVAGKAHAGLGTFLVVGPEGRVYVAWSDTRNDSEGDLYADASPDGVSFGTDVVVSDSTLRYQEDPSLAVGTTGPCKGWVYAVWQDFRSNKDYDIYSSRSTDKGKTWDKNVVATPKTAGDQMNPAVEVASDCNVAVSWRDSSANPKFDIKATFFTW